MCQTATADPSALHELRIRNAQAGVNRWLYGNQDLFTAAEWRLFDALVAECRSLTQLAVAAEAVEAIVRERAA